MSDMQYEIIPFGDSGFLVKFPTETYSAKVTNHIHSVIAQLSGEESWEELVPGYNSLLAYFCPEKFPPAQARAALYKTLKSTEKTNLASGNLVEIPVCYGGEYGPDIEIIEASSGLSAEAITKLHSEPEYTVCMMGFIPGFTFLSEAPKTLHHKRKASPRSLVPAGSVGIAGWQTGIYGLESPGGWQIIGRTPLKIFDSARETPFLLQAGDRIKFVPVSAQAFRESSND